MSGNLDREICGKQAIAETVFVESRIHPAPSGCHEGAVVHYNDLIGGVKSVSEKKLEMFHSYLSSKTRIFLSTM